VSKLQFGANNDFRFCDRESLLIGNGHRSQLLSKSPQMGRKFIANNQGIYGLWTKKFSEFGKHGKMGN